MYPQRFDLFSLVRGNTPRYPFLLESTAQQQRSTNSTSRYDILFCFPQQVLRKTREGRLELDGAPYPGEAFLTALDSLWRDQRTQTIHLPGIPFTGGWFLYLAYELAGEIEPSLSLPLQGSELPIAQATRIPAAVIYDHAQDQTTVIVEPGQAALLEIIEHDLFTTEISAEPDIGDLCLGLAEDEPQRYLENTRKILHYIREGDVFQVNLSRQWQGEIIHPDSAFLLYENLRKCNPAPFAGFTALDEGYIVSSSPERLVRVCRERIETRPIAGTRPRMQTRQQDDSIQVELIQHPKERAEHVMLIDLERNDLGRICIPGSVKVDEMMVIESYAHVHHIVSNVCGQLRPDITPGQAIAAVFPGGTITGCPKVRCMEIIAELEQTARGAYTGSFGYLNHNGDMDLNILIRTISVEANRVYFRTGAGIVADSVPEQELAETRAKAKGLYLAVMKDMEDAHAALPG
ncbi:MAG: aminodeoxychorismate synthase component I [Gammaproteobacteria bacterium]|nr:aminodeoxychorismate synthase component I [Gammaproteobacteria bacterium]